MKISGIMPLRNAVKLGYPFELAIRSLQPLCDEVVVLVDPMSEDDTLARVRALSPDVIVESAWDMTNHSGHTNCEISVQTAKACAAASGEWILSLQADEMLHESEVDNLRQCVARAEAGGVTGIELRRLYFYGSLDRVREDWTLWLLRLFRRGLWQPDVDGAMRFNPVGEQHQGRVAARLYHYSRIGNPCQVAARVRNLDLFFHSPDAVADEILPYDFGTMRKLDTYAVGVEPEADPHAALTVFPIGAHPRAAREYFLHE